MTYAFPSYPQYGRQEEDEGNDAEQQTTDGAHGEREPEGLFVGTVDEEGNHAQDGGKDGEADIHQIVYHNNENYSFYC